MKPQRLSLESEALEEFRANFDNALERLCEQIVKKKLTRGVVSAKVAITLTENADKETGEIYYKMEIEPDVKRKLSADYKIPCGKKDGIIMQMDPYGRPMIADEQISFDDLIPEEKRA